MSDYEIIMIILTVIGIIVKLLIELIKKEVTAESRKQAVTF